MFAACCGRYLSGLAPAPDAAALMRSRYSAYVRQDEAYLLATWHASTRPARLALDAPPVPKWLGLTVLACTPDPVDAARATVEFVARYKVGGRAQRMREISRFVCEGGRWSYLDGDVS